tara:strand:+ start:595 stop:792 length:198 start_codon:yes stop_codon:yes gene_type:complete
MCEPKEWTLVVFASDCYSKDWDKDRECIICIICHEQYADCPCPGPTQDGYIYKEIDGKLYAKEET